MTNYSLSPFSSRFDRSRKLLCFYQWISIFPSFGLFWFSHLCGWVNYFINTSSYINKVCNNINFSKIDVRLIMRLTEFSLNNFKSLIDSCKARCFKSFGLRTSIPCSSGVLSNIVHNLPFVLW